MLPVSIILAMVFRNIQPRPKEQRLIKDLLMFEDASAYGDMVRKYENRRHDIDNETYKSLSLGSLPEHDEPQNKPAEEPARDDESTSSTSSTSSESESDAPPTEDEFVTPTEQTQPGTPDSERSSAAAVKPRMTPDNQTEFSTAIEGDLDTFVGILPWWVSIIAWTLALIASVVSGFFVILYTFQFGPEKTKAWCVSVLTSFFFGLLLEQPVKILLVAFALAFICRKATDIYPTELDIVADHSVRSTSARLSVCLFHSYC